jgi:myosin heavy subunit
LYLKQYSSEGINWQHIDFADNSEVVDLLEGRKVGTTGFLILTVHLRRLFQGIIASLNEECLIPKGNDPNLLSKVICRALVRWCV